jgi:D-glycero-D-manno-heptose 1,7-bisphosphate phosphatase
VTRPAVFLDRDGVLNEVEVRDGRPHPPADAEHLKLLPGVERACETLRAAGLPLIVVTNQPDIGRGTTDVAQVARINERLRESLDLDEIIVCPHDDVDDCPCRKPRPGMLLDAAARHGIDLAASVMVGDRWRDIEAGKAAGTKTVFIDRGYRERQPIDPDLTVRELDEGIPWILDATASTTSKVSGR